MRAIARASLRQRLLVCAVACLGLLHLLVPAAAADQVICVAGSDAGQCNGPAAVAVDEDDELFYVADNGNLRVAVFAASGTFLRAFGWDVAPDGAPGDTAANQFEICTTVCQAGSSGAGAGQFASLSGIAVDSDPASTALHDVYVLDDANNRVQRFHANGEFVLAFGKAVNQTSGGDVCPRPGFPADVCKAGTEGTGVGQIAASPKIDVGPGGIVHVADNIGGGDRRVQKFNHLGEPISACSPLAPGGFGENFAGFAVESTGNFYVASAGGRPVRKYDAGCSLIGEFHASFNIQAIAVDGDDNLFVADATGGAPTAIYVYTSTGTLFHVLYGNGTLLARPGSLAPFTSGGGEHEVLAVEVPAPPAPRRVVQLAFEPPGPAIHPDPDQTFAMPTGNTKATLNTRINPEGEATTYHFEYLDDAGYLADKGAGGDGFGAASSTPEATLVAPADPSFAPPLFRLATASTQVGCPKPTEQLIAEGKCLKPSTKYHFRAIATNAEAPGGRIGPEQSFETAPPFELLAIWSSEVGADAAKLSAEVNPLGIEATGRFEYVEEGKGFEEGQVVGGLDFGVSESPQIGSVQLHSLKPDTTYRYRLVVENIFGFTEAREGAFTTFPRAAESPPCPNDAFRAGPGAGLPDCRAYEMVSPVDKEGGEIVVQRSINGSLPAEVNQSVPAVPGLGRGLTYSSQWAFGDAKSAPYTSQYMAHRAPLGHPQEGWSSEGISPPREGPSFYSLGFLETQYKVFSEDLGYGWLRSDSEPPLSAEAIAGFANLYRYESATDSYEALCSVEPENETSHDYIPDLMALSGDGRVTAFRANDRLTEDASFKADSFQLYACREGELRLVSVLPSGEANPGESGAGTFHGGNGNHRRNSVHNAVSVDGSRIYWSDASGPGRIFLRENPFGAGAECTAGGPCTVGVSEAVGVPGADEKAFYWTASPDGSVAIFSFRDGPLAGNLYRFEAATGTASPIAEGVVGLAGWSEDASRLYLVSTKELAAGAVAGKSNLYLSREGDFELVATLSDVSVGNYCEIATAIPVQRCTRASGDGRRLVFMTQDPLTGYDNRDAVSGKPDAEVFLYEAGASGGEGELRCISCNLSGGRPQGRGVPLPGSTVPAWLAAQIPTWESAFYASRVLSADGRRLFFESFDPLVGEDTNGAQDLYQWEEAGKGDCEGSSATFVESANGCISLISSGEDRHDSEFMDASADGSDVFFKTSESLMPQDPGLIDIYDARIEGGFPPPPPQQPPCEGEACQSPPAAPEDSSPSSGLQRPGNPQPKRACPRGKRRVGKGAKARCVKKKRKRSGHHRKGGRR